VMKGLYKAFFPLCQFMANRGSRNRTGWDEIARKNNTVEQSGHEDPVYESFRSSMKYSQVIPLFFFESYRINRA
jgi:hypothetical protein